MQRDAVGSMRMDSWKITGEDSIGSQSREDSWKSCVSLRDARRKAKKQGKRKDPVGSHQIGEMCYEGVTRQHALKLFRQHQERIEKKDRKKGSPEQRDNAQLSQMETQLPVICPETTEESVTQALNKEAVKKEAIKKAALNKEALKKEAPKKEALHEEALNKEAPKKEALHKEAPKKEAVNKEALNVLNSYQSAKRSEMHATAPVPAFYSQLPPEYREKLWKKTQENKAVMEAIMACGTENKRSQNSPGEAENKLGQKRLEMSGKPAAAGGKPDETRLEMLRISRDRQLDAKIHKALIDVRHMLTSKETTKINKDTLRLLKDVSSYKFEVLEDHGGGDDDQNCEMDKLAIDQTCLNTNDNSGNSPLLVAKKAAAKEMAEEAESFASYRRLWEQEWRQTCSIFTEATLLSSMQFTHYTPGRIVSNPECSTMETLQIISIQLTQLADGLDFPLSVYGVVAVRDMVDRNRNVLFFRNSYEAQELKQNDSFLHLVGPSRAILFRNNVWIEIELRVKGRAYSQLMSCARRYNGGDPGVSSICFKNALCTLELCLQPVEKAIQATILGVQVSKDDGSWPFKYGGIVACTPQSGTLRVTDDRITREIDTSSTQIVLIESKDDAMPKGQNGYVLLRRQVVSVQLEGRLEVIIKAYSKSGGIVAETCVSFDPHVCNISRKKFDLGDDAQGAVTIAWSRVAASKMGASVELNGV